MPEDFRKVTKNDWQRTEKWARGWIVKHAVVWILTLPNVANAVQRWHDQAAANVMWKVTSRWEPWYACWLNVIIFYETALIMSEQDSGHTHTCCWYKFRGTQELLQSMCMLEKWKQCRGYYLLLLPTYCYSTGLAWGWPSSFSAQETTLGHSCVKNAKSVKIRESWCSELEICNIHLLEKWNFNWELCWTIKIPMNKTHEYYKYLKLQ